MARKPNDPETSRWAFVILLLMGLVSCSLVYIGLSSAFNPMISIHSQLGDGGVNQGSIGVRGLEENLGLGEECCGGSNIWNFGALLSNGEECCRACKGMCTGRDGPCLCDSWVFCGNRDACGSKFGEALKTTSTTEKDQIPPTNVEAQSPTGVGGGGSSSQWNQFDRKHRRLEIPTFEGSNLDGWILKAERFFSFQRYNNEEKIEATVVSFEADALLWYQWESKRRPILFWEELKGLLLKQFRANQEGSLCEQFLALRQEGSVAEYRRKFVTLAAPLETLTEHVYLIINGLKPAIREISWPQIDKIWEIRSFGHLGSSLGKDRYGIVGLETEYGTMHIKLFPECAPNSVNYILELLGMRHCAGCQFYRAEGRGRSWDSEGNHRENAPFGPPFELIQGTLEAQGTPFNKIPAEACPSIRRGSVAWVGSGPEFFISLANHNEWRTDYTVFGTVLPEVMQIAEKIAVLPTKGDVWSNVNVTVLEKPIPLLIQRIK